MARLNRATFALMLALLPATATAVGFIVLRQAPTVVRRQGRPQGGTPPGPLTLTHTGL